MNATEKLSQLRIITATDGAGTNCHDRALVALRLFPQLRAVIGTLLLQGGCCLRTGDPIPWAKPWGHHVWLIEPDGDYYYDPSAGNLEHWARTQEVRLPRPWQELTAGMIELGREQRELLTSLLRGDLPQGLPDAIYLPGVVYSSSIEELPQSPHYVHAWGRLAFESVRAGGWDAAQLEEALGRVDSLMAEPPSLRLSEVPPRPSGRKGRGRGFGRGVA